MKKLLSTIMALVMLLSLVPMAVAEEGATKWSEKKTEKSVAQVGNMFYETLADAVASVPVDGTETTITLLKDANGDGITVQGGKVFTLDFDGHSYTVNGKPTGSKGTESQAFQLLTGSTIVFKNGKIIGDTPGVQMLIQNYCDLTLDNMTLDATAGNNKVSYSMSNNCGNVSIKDTTITAKANGVAFDVYGGFQDYSDVTVTVTGNSVINGKVELARDSKYPNNKNQNKLVIVGGTINGQICKNSGEVVVKGGAFTDLASAVKYATDGATITLAENVALDKAISIGSSEGKTIVLDLAGKTLKGNIDFYAGDLTIQNGTIDGCVYANATETDVKYGHLTIASDAVIDSKYAVILYQGGVGANNFGSIIDVYGTLKGNLWVMGNITTDLAAAKNPCEVNIHDGAVIDSQESSDIGIALNGAAKMTVGKARITSTTGIEVRAGELTVNGATVVGTGDCIEVNPNGSGTTTDGAGIAVAQHTTQLPIKVTINSGDISGCSALYQSNPQNNDAESVKRVSVAVNGGTFKAINGGTVSVYSENNCVAVSGGTFSSDPTAFVNDETLVVVPENGTFTVKAATTKSEDGNTTTTIKVSEDGKTVTETKTETKVEGNVTTKTETVTEKNAAGETTKVTESKIVENTENGKTETKTTVDGKTVKTDVTVSQAPATASDVKLNAKALEGKAAGTETSSVTVDKASLSELKNNTVKGVIIETDQATLKLDKTAVKTMEGNVPTNGKMTLNVTVTEEKNATTTDIEKVKVEVTAKNEAGENVFPENTANTNGLINITIPYTGNAKYLDLWYIAANASATYMGRFPVVNGFVSFDVKHFSQYDLIPVASSGSSVIKTGAGSSAASTTQTVTTDLTPGSITKVTVDGKVVDAKYYTVSGSNVTFTAEFLKTLKNGSHTVTVENATKIAKGVFTVNNPTTAVQAPTTADAGIALYAGMAIASVMGTGVVFTSRKRKNH